MASFTEVGDKSRFDASDASLRPTATPSEACRLRRLSPGPGSPDSHNVPAHMCAHAHASHAPRTQAGACLRKGATEGRAGRRRALPSGRRSLSPWRWCGRGSRCMRLSGAPPQMHETNISRLCRSHSTSRFIPGTTRTARQVEI